MASAAVPRHRPWLAAIITTWDDLLVGLSGSPHLDATRAALLQHSAGDAAMRILVGATVNHVRRILAPGLGQFMWRHALADMKLARSSPHHFLADAAAGLAWTRLAWWACAAALAARARRFAGDRARADDLGVGWMVLYVAATLARAEAAYVQTCWTLAQLYAYAALFRGGAAEAEFLERFLAENPARVTVQLGLVTGWIATAVVPVLRRGVLEGRFAALAVHGAVWATTAYLVRYSNKYFVLLEMSDMFVTFGWMACGMVFVGMEALRLASQRGVREEAAVTADGLDTNTKTEGRRINS